ncbi:MAG: GNAT family N-acetyltransferase [Deltaproteobacteria bacterium]|nr:GNAT family N-acetyltransferase [Deltaproteobacteria bacterium]
MGNVDAPLFHQLALPSDADLDEFTSGNTEVDEYFSKRRWFDTGKNEHSPPTYQFRTAEHGEVVGYAAVAFRSGPHPNDNSTTRAKYLVVYVAAVHSRFAGQRNPARPSESFAASMFSILEAIARAKAGCVGLSLRVRTDNHRAIAFYEKVGFVRDPGGPRALDNKAPHLTMRKTW